jgi:hypothetical protein
MIRSCLVVTTNTVMTRVCWMTCRPRQFALNALSAQAVELPPLEKKEIRRITEVGGGDDDDDDDGDDDDGLVSLWGARGRVWEFLVMLS